MTSRWLPSAGRAFVDSSGFFALKAANDANHQTARTLLYELADVRRRLITTNYVVGKTHALMLSRLGYTAALTWLLDIRESPGTAIVRVNVNGS
ncbi:MAG: type II toxin-antitoxin system VapC family toxin [Dehalococcoidia bacterium]